MKKNLIYQCPILYSLDENDASGLCYSGSAATGAVKIQCNTGDSVGEGPQRTDGPLPASCISVGPDDSSDWAINCSDGTQVYPTFSACYTG